MKPSTPTVELKIKNSEEVSDYFDEMDEELREEFKDDLPVIEVIIKKENK